MRSCAAVIVAPTRDDRVVAEGIVGSEHVGRSLLRNAIAARVPWFRGTAPLSLGDCESSRTPLRASAHGVADLCFGDACLPESCKHRMLEFGDDEVARRAQRLALYWS
jgi:hypothetical protein